MAWFLFWVVSTILAFVLGAWAGVYFRNFAEPVALMGTFVKWIQSKVGKK